MRLNVARTSLKLSGNKTLCNCAGMKGHGWNGPWKIWNLNCWLKTKHIGCREEEHPKIRQTQGNEMPKNAFSCFACRKRKWILHLFAIFQWTSALFRTLKCIHTSFYYGDVSSATCGRATPRWRSKTNSFNLICGWLSSVPHACIGLFVSNVDKTMQIAWLQWCFKRDKLWYDYCTPTGNFHMNLVAVAWNT